MLAQFLQLLIDEVGRGVYVWGGNGETVSDMADPENWIRRHETSAENGARAIALYRKRVADGIKTIRGFDCSGLVHYAMKASGARRGDLSSRGFHGVCKKIGKAQVLPGDLVFRRNQSGTICHVGVYIGGGETVECYGRDVGVVRRALGERWSDFGRYPTLAAEQERLSEDGAVALPDVQINAPRALSVQTPLLRGDDVKRLQTRLQAMGYTVGGAGVDGVYGEDTASAVESFRTRAAALPAEGTGDEAMLALIGLWG